MGKLFEKVVNYTPKYAEAYKSNFDFLTSPLPEGEGMPKVPAPTFASSDSLDSWVAKDGVIFLDGSNAPDYRWEIAGGPALAVDTEPSQIPKWVTDVRKDNDLLGKQIGIYRIVGENFKEDVWQGLLPTPLQSHSMVTSFNKTINFHETDCNINEVLARATFGAFEHVLDLHLKTDDADFWNNHRIDNMGFVAGAYADKRYFRRIEIAHNYSLAAWDARSIWIRVRHDCIRDIIGSTNFIEKGGASIDFGSRYTDLSRIYDRTRLFEEVISGLVKKLGEYPDAYESIYHKFFEQHPEVLDIYGNVTSKPQFVYPPNTAPTGKTHVEPDFVISYPDGTFRIIEIERPEKRLATKSGQPRSEVTQAAYQITEFRTYIEDHAVQLQDRFPGIRASNCKYSILLGRVNSLEDSVFKSFSELRSHVRTTFNVDDIWTYEDLIERAASGLATLRSISILGPR